MQLLAFHFEANRQHSAPSVQKKLEVHLIHKLSGISGNLPEVLYEVTDPKICLRQPGLQTLQCGLHRCRIRGTGSRLQVGCEVTDELRHEYQRDAYGIHHRTDDGIVPEGREFWELPRHELARQVFYFLEARACLCH